MPGRRRQRGEGSLYQRGRRSGRTDGRWVAVVDLGWKGDKRDRREFTGASPDEALEKRARFLHQHRGGFTLPRGRPLTVAEWMRHWLAGIRREVKASTWERSYRQKVTDLICPWFERVPLPELTIEHIEEWHRQLEARVSPRTGRSLSPKTITDCHRIFSSAIRVAVARGHLPRNPVTFVSPPRVTRQEAQPPTGEEIALVLDRCETWPNGARWVTAIATGIRQGEALALRWRDVRLDGNPSLTVRGDVKTEAARRTIPLPPVAVDALRAHRARRSVADIGGLVFTREDGRPVHPRADWQDWQNLLRELGLPHYRVHDLRHAFATYLLEQGIDVRVVQELIGHASADFTRRTYQHVRPALHDAARDAMQRALRGS